jgi:hypothetical protein
MMKIAKLLFTNLRGGWKRCRRRKRERRRGWFSFVELCAEERDDGRGDGGAERW